MNNTTNSIEYLAIAGKYTGPKLAWHYTTRERLDDILEDGYLKVAMANVPEHERPILWVSANQNWEPTALKAGIDPFGDKIRPKCRWKQYEMFGAVRFGFDFGKFIHWSELKKQSGMTKTDAKVLQKAGKKLGSDPNDWFGTFENLPLQHNLLSLCYWHVEDDAHPSSGYWCEILTED